MTTASQARKPRKAPQVVSGSARWVGGVPSQARLDDGAAILQITAEGKEPGFYHVETNRDGDEVRGYRLIKIDALLNAATYDVEITANGFRCDCPDATYTDRPGGCKHCRGLAAGLKAANLL
jgi:hypothetical protein